jgi:hypothetical protein
MLRQYGGETGRPADVQGWGFLGFNADTFPLNPRSHPMKALIGAFVLTCLGLTVVAEDVVTTTTTKTTTSTEVVPSKPKAKDCHGYTKTYRRARKDAVREARAEVREEYGR